MVSVSGSDLGLGGSIPSQSDWPKYAAIAGGVIGLGVLAYRLTFRSSTPADPNAPTQTSTTAFLNSIGEQLLQFRGDQSMANADQLTRDTTLLGAINTSAASSTGQNADILDYLNSMAAQGLINDNRLREILAVNGLDAAARANQLGEMISGISGGGVSSDLIGQNLQDIYTQIVTDPNVSPIETNDPTLNDGSGSAWFAARSATAPSKKASAWGVNNVTAFV